jgi:hypothetical protein
MRGGGLRQALISAATGAESDDFALEIGHTADLGPRYPVETWARGVADDQFSFLGVHR